MSLFIKKTLRYNRLKTKFKDSVSILFDKPCIYDDYRMQGDRPF